MQRIIPFIEALKKAGNLVENEAKTLVYGCIITWSDKLKIRLTCPPKTVPDIMLGIDKKGAIDGKERLHTGADY